LFVGLVFGVFFSQLAHKPIAKLPRFWGSWIYL